tara:strand:- start:551 stop:1189 length:639 start_codon:yes stop_codon:yes gene_type:complete
VQLGQKTEKTKEEEATTEDLSSTLFGFFDDNKPEPLRVTGIYGEISEEKCGDVIHHMLSLNQSGRTESEDGSTAVKPFEFVISTWGGSAADMFAVYDVMRMIRQECTIKTTGLGKVMSAGVLLLASGTKGSRRIGKYCRVMLHSAASGHVGELYNLENELEELKMTQKAYIKALSSETDMSASYLKKLLNKRVNVYLTAQEALDLGIVDEII